MDDFGFLTNHGRVLLCLARNPSARMRDVAMWLEITERAVQRIVVDLEVAGYLKVAKDGRRNLYAVDQRRPLRHRAEGGRSVGALLRLADGASMPPPISIGGAGFSGVPDADERRPTESFID